MSDSEVVPASATANTEPPAGSDADAPKPSPSNAVFGWQVTLERLAIEGIA